MDFNLIWKTLIVFNFFFSLIWICFDTYRAPFMNDHDFVKPGGGRGVGPDGRSDASLSMAGRSLIFLIAIISSLILGMIFFLSYDYFNKPTFKCTKGKSLKECKLIK